MAAQAGRQAGRQSLISVAQLSHQLRSAWHGMRTDPFLVSVSTNLICPTGLFMMRGRGAAGAAGSRRIGATIFGLE